MEIEQDAKILAQAYKEQVRARAIAKERQRLEQDEKGRFNSALFNIVNTEDGRRVFKHLFNLIPTDNSSFSSDPLLMAFNEGKRAVTVELRNVIKNELGLNALYAIDTQEL